MKFYSRDLKFYSRDVKFYSREWNQILLLKLVDVLIIYKQVIPESSIRVGFVIRNKSRVQIFRIDE